MSFDLPIILSFVLDELFCFVIDNYGEHLTRIVLREFLSLPTLPTVEDVKTIQGYLNKSLKPPGEYFYRRICFPDLIQYSHLIPALFLLKCRLVPENEFHSSAFLDACTRGYLEIVKLILQPRCVNDGLINASKNGHLNVVRYLVEKKADVHVKKDEPLMFATRYGHLSTVQYLLEQGANPKARNCEVIGHAKWNGSPSIIDCFSNLKLN